MRTNNARRVVRSLAAVTLLSVCSRLVADDAERVATLVEQGRKGLAAGEYSQASEALYHAFELAPDNPDVNFLLGRAAFAGGDYEAAVMAFERVVIARPGADRARLELARSYFAMGLLELAQTYFEEVLAHDPPAGIRQNVESFLKQISVRQKTRQRHRFFGNLSLSLGWDTNARVSPDHTEIAVDPGLFPGGTLQLTGDAADQASDMTSTLSLALTHRYRFFGQNRFWETSGLFHEAAYSTENDQELQVVSASTGPLWQDSRGTLALQANVMHLWKDYATYLVSYGMVAPCTLVVSDRFLFSTVVRCDRKDYKEGTDRKATNMSIEFRPVVMWNRARSRLTFRLRLERENADDVETESFKRLGVACRYERDLPLRMMAYARVRYQHSDYDERNLLFADDRRDELCEVRAGVTKSFTDQVSAELSHTHTDASSSIDLYEYDRDLTTVSVNVRF